VRILLVSGVGVGGAARSTYELARTLAHRGHDVGLVVRDETAPRRYEMHRRLVNLRVKTAGKPGAGFVDRLARFVGRGLRPGSAVPGAQSWIAIRPENALAAAIREIRPDIIVVNSIDLPAWRQLRADVAAQGIPVALYLREENGLLHLSHSHIDPDLLLANAQGHADGAAALGYEAIVVPSIVDCTTCRVTSTRERVLFINPVEMYGVDIALALAQQRPAIPFAFVESWPLADDDFAALEATLAALPNVELRRFLDTPQKLYGDTRVLLVPYRYPGRSRVVAEAQCNGIPVLASSLYGIAEAVGPGGILADPDGPLSVWLDALDRLWNDGAAYDALSAAALEHSGRAEMQPEHVVGVLEDALAHTIDEYAAS
jgi:glycosyltransferase involved in cell wall biosynthesis